MRITACLALLLAACGPAPSEATLPRELEPVENPFGPSDPYYTEQPRRDRPRVIVQAGERLVVALQGTESRPGREVAVLDAATLDVLARVEVGSSPTGLAAHPSGRFVAVACRFASYVPILDVETLRVVLEVPAPFYTEAIDFSPDGTGAILANRWKDSVIRWRVRVEGARVEVEPRDVLATPSAPVGIGVDANPRRVRYLDDGARALVTSEAALSVSLLDVERGQLLARHSPNAPVIDAVPVGGFVYVLHTGQGTQHPPDDGFDGDGDGHPGDGTANVGFQDLQNEIDVLDARDLTLLHRYTSDTLCCRDYRDVDPDRPESGLELAPVDVWPPERVAFLPPREAWIVAGAMPERAVPFTRADGRDALAVVFGGSSEVQTFDVDAETGALTPRERAPALHPTGFGAVDALFQESARRLVVVERLGEALTVVDLDGPPAAEPERVIVGDVRGGAFPATDAELGEAFNTLTAAFGIDGDQTCVHCHRDGSPVGKPVSMPLLVAPEWGVRNVMAYRGAYDTRPWFVEAAMDEDNFFPVINELARRENFCCEQTDPRVWSRYPSRAECEAEPARAGCAHVLDCVADPPPECAARPYGGAELTRDRHFRAAALRVFGRSESFGDALYSERVGSGGQIERRPIPLGFDGITRALGLFLLADARLLPNPNAAVVDARQRVGAALFASARTGCASCHPLPIGATAFSTVVTDAPGPIRFPYVVSPVRHPLTGADVDRVNVGFLGTFPDARQTDAGLRVGSTSLRGLWDRVRFYHHGQARTLREAIAAPGHPALREGERGFNERDGQPDTHGSTSALSGDELDALTAFLESL